MGHVQLKIPKYAQNSSKFDILEKKFEYTLQYSRTRKKVYSYTPAYFELKIVSQLFWAFYNMLTKFEGDPPNHFREIMDLVKSCEKLR